MALTKLFLLFYFQFFFTAFDIRLSSYVRLSLPRIKPNNNWYEEIFSRNHLDKMVYTMKTRFVAIASANEELSKKNGTTIYAKYIDT